MDRDLMPLCSTPHRRYSTSSNNDKPPHCGQLNALVDLQMYLKARSSSKKRLLSSDKHPPTTTSGAGSAASGKRRLSLCSRESLKRFLPHRNHRTHSVCAAHHAPLLTSGMPIRDKYGAPLTLPDSAHVINNIQLAQRLQPIVKSMDKQYVNKAYECDNVASRYIHKVNQMKHESLSEVNKENQQLQQQATRDDIVTTKRDVTKVVHTAHVDKAKAKRSCSTTTKVASRLTKKKYLRSTLSEMSSISGSSQMTVREQASAIQSGSVAAILHSTLNYPLHSTVLSEPADCISSLSIDVDAEPACQSSSSLEHTTTATAAAAAAPPVSRSSIKRLRRQTARVMLTRCHDPVMLSLSDVEHERTVDTTLNYSSNATCGSRLNAELTQSPSEQSSRTSSDVTQVTITNKDDESTIVRQGNLETRRVSSKRRPSDASVNLSHEQKRELKKKLKSFNQSLRSDKSDNQIRPLGVV